MFKPASSPPPSARLTEDRLLSSLAKPWYRLDRIDVTLCIVITFYVLTVPFTKVEESFNTQAIRDILTYGLGDINFYAQANALSVGTVTNHTSDWNSNVPSTSSINNIIANYDHLKFPGVVPRTFVGPVLVALLTYTAQSVLYGVVTILDHINPSLYTTLSTFALRLASALPPFSTHDGRLGLHAMLSRPPPPLPLSYLFNFNLDTIETSVDPSKSRQPLAFGVRQVLLFIRWIYRSVSTAFISSLHSFFHTLDRIVDWLDYILPFRVITHSFGIQSYFKEVVRSSSTSSSSFFNSLSLSSAPSSPSPLSPLSSTTIPPYLLTYATTPSPTLLSAATFRQTASVPLPLSPHPTLGQTFHSAFPSSSPINATSLVSSSSTAFLLLSSCAGCLRDDNLYLLVLSRIVMGLITAFSFISIRRSLSFLTNYALLVPKLIPGPSNSTTPSSSSSSSTSTSPPLNTSSSFPTDRLPSLDKIFVLVTLLQFHLMFYSSRTLPNIFALQCIAFATSFWLRGHHALFISLLAFTCIVYRCDMVS